MADFDPVARLELCLRQCRDYYGRVGKKRKERKGYIDASTHEEPECIGRTFKSNCQKIVSRNEIGKDFQAQDESRN